MRPKDTLERPFVVLYYSEREIRLHFCIYAPSKYITIIQFMDIYEAWIEPRYFVVEWVSSEMTNMTQIATTYAVSHSIPPRYYTKRIQDERV